MDDADDGKVEFAFIPTNYDIMATVTMPNAAQYTFLVMNGPNLGHLGKRQPEIYGHQSMEDLPELARQVMGPAFDNIALQFYQSNCEGALINRLEKAWKTGVHGVALNAGAYTHTSLALADCLAWIKLPTVEVHLSNIWARPEPIRHQSFIGTKVIGVIAGFGLLSYALALQALYQHLHHPSA
ncbi:type II 3-dehydroquinate dehydratase [Megalodesulfovibrio paquesii]